jgi:tRNA A-37 threonylcarbamoyl transferase component Bud32
MDPRELLRQAFPSYGPGWDAAIEAGVDVSLLEENLRLTPTERLEQLQRMTELYEALRPKDRLVEKELQALRDRLKNRQR